MLSKFPPLEKAEEASGLCLKTGKMFPPMLKRGVELKLIFFTKCGSTAFIKKNFKDNIYFNLP